MSGRLITVSVVIVTRDRPYLLRDALASVAAQERSPLETLIADDGETPVDLGEAADGLLEVRVLPAGGQGAVAGRNLAAGAARGDLLAVPDGDDRWLPGHLAGFAPAFEGPPLAVAYRR